MKTLMTLILFFALNSSGESVEEFLNSIPDSAPQTMEEADAQIHAKYKPCWNDRQCRDSEVCLDDGDGKNLECTNLEDPSRSTR